MLDIRPISDLRNKFTDIENAVLNKGPVILTKNGYGSMVVMSIQEYERLTSNIENALDEAEKQASETDKRLSHEEVFGNFSKR